MLEEKYFKTDFFFKRDVASLWTLTTVAWGASALQGQIYNGLTDTLSSLQPLTFFGSIYFKILEHFIRGNEKRKWKVIQPLFPLCTVALHL